MTKEALKLALEALENSVDRVREDAYEAEKLYGNYPTRQRKVGGLKVLADDHEKAITALREALAQPDAFEQGRQEGMKQERALWELSKLGQEIEAQPEKCQCPECQIKPHTSDCFVHNEPAYPKGECNCGAQPQRPWVGLTDEEMYEAVRPLCKADSVARSLFDVSKDEYRAIEAKLKEKNFG